MTTQNVVGVYRGVAHWHRVVDDQRGVGWGLELEPKLRPPRDSDFAIDISPPPPYGPQDFAVEVTFKRRITTHWPAVGWSPMILLVGGMACVVTSLWFPDGYVKRFLATCGLTMSLMACIVVLRSARQSLRALKAAEVRLREAQARLEDSIANSPDENAQAH